MTTIVNNEVKTVKIYSDFFKVEFFEDIHGLNTPKGYLKDGLRWFFDDEEKDIRNLSKEELQMMHDEICNFTCAGFDEAMNKSFENNNNDEYLYECVARFITFNAAISPRFYRCFMTTGRADIRYDEDSKEWSAKLYL